MFNSIDILICVNVFDISKNKIKLNGIEDDFERNTFTQTRFGLKGDHNYPIAYTMLDWC